MPERSVANKEVGAGECKCDEKAPVVLNGKDVESHVHKLVEISVIFFSLLFRASPEMTCEGGWQRELSELKC